MWHLSINIVIQEMPLKNLIKDMDYTCFYFYLCKMFLEWDFGSKYYQKRIF